MRSKNYTLVVVTISIVIGVVFAIGERFGLAQWFMDFLWGFYVFTWLLINSLFGGIHGAPDWSFSMTAFLAVIAQNLLIWAVLKFSVKLVKRKRETNDSRTT